MNPDQKVEEITMNFEDKTSLFNDQYFCKVLSLKYADGIVEIGFKVTGDNSLGPLQNPTSSKLFVNDVDYSTFAHEYSQQNPLSTYEGVLRYQVVSNLVGEVEFKFGDGGYSSVLLHDFGGGVPKLPIFDFNNINLIGKPENSNPKLGSQIKIVGIYFSAEWCHFCTIFTPKLVDFYNKINSQGHIFEIIFVSFDEDQSSFEEYYSKMPWLALNFENKEIKVMSAKKLKISGFPHLGLLNANGYMYKKDVTQDVLEAETAEQISDVFNSWIPHSDDV